MARDYKGKRLRSSDEKLLEEGAYVCVPVETLERVKELLGAYWEEEKYKDQLDIISDIENELFPEESCK